MCSFTAGETISTEQKQIWMLPTQFLFCFNVDIWPFFFFYLVSWLPFEVWKEWRGLKKRGRIESGLKRGIGCLLQCVCVRSSFSFPFFFLWGGAFAIGIQSFKLQTSGTKHTHTHTKKWRGRKMRRKGNIFQSFCISMLLALEEIMWIVGIASRI